ncbi:DUF5689 domain-containing protein [uncultured Acetobacteroides sp.]|uniref:DUF5689 domain-containing protein n=1 Tax=uncultured Acetobacteroides sp. TaxID=1760811 RepID=UPI0029F49F9E|nr:DUF5689 domain-containing protein [uncultured Acetobacteroides sp.]
MKTKQFSIILTVLCGFLSGLSGCTPEFDEPTVKEYKYEKAATLTIAQFKSTYNYDFKQITDPVILKGVVNATDESGNIYKKLYLQDETGGLEISLDATSLYTQFKVGQEIYIECKGLYVGKYGGVLQLGFPYKKNGVDAIGRMPQVVAMAHIFKNGTPNKVVTPIAVNSLSELNNSMLDKVVSLKVFFTNGGKEKYADKSSQYPTEQAFTDLKGAKGIIYTSGYARFSQELLPKGLGTITAILSAYNGKWQLIIRDKNDVGTFDASVTTPPVYQGEATHTISQLKATCNSKLQLIQSNMVVKGVVTASDESGNIYKKLYIQDQSGAIAVNINAKGLFNSYPVGQEIFIECRDLYIGNSNGNIELGASYNGNIGQMEDATASSHIFTKQAAITPIAPLATTIAELTDDMNGKLITLSNMKFTNGDVSYYVSNNKPTSEEMKDDNGNSIIVYTSNYATFANEKLPSGHVTITAILTKFDGKWQLILRNTKDVVKD